MKARPGQQRYFSPTEAGILEAYLQLCYQHGVTAITLQMVAKKAKVAFGTVHYHFGGSETSLEESAISYVGTVGQEYISEYLKKAAGKPGYNGLEEYIVGSLKWQREFPYQISYWLHFFYLASINSKYRERNQPFLSTARERIQSLIYEGIGMKRIPPIEDIERLAVKINSLLFGVAFVAAADPSTEMQSQAPKITLEAVRALIKSHASR